ncbi:hypothetical protein [Streptomyces sp. 2A115]|uniref:hypothetical protein n=1 Tax=Streptomyces sp. 2A115 TaxID=3457439 RepID=UPI003FD05741
MRGPEQPVWLERLETEHGNIRAALEWCIERNDASRALRMAGALYQFWDLRGHYAQGRGWLARALALSAPTPMPNRDEGRDGEGGTTTGAAGAAGAAVPDTDTDRAHALLAAACLAVGQGDLPMVVTACRQAMALCERAGDLRGMAHARANLGLAALYSDALERAEEHLAEAGRCARLADDRWLEGWSLTFRTMTAITAGDRSGAAEFSVRAESAHRELADPKGLAWAALLRGAVRWDGDDSAGATAALREALHTFRKISGGWGLSLTMLLSARMTGEHGDHLRSTTLLSAAESLRTSIGAALLPFATTWRDRSTARARDALGAERFEAAWRAASALDPLEVMYEALADADMVGRTVPMG